MIAFIDENRDEYGVEPICRALPIAPSTYHAEAAARVDPLQEIGRAQRDMALKVHVRRVFDENFGVYGVRKVWRLMKREGADVARCTIARLMKAMGLAGVIRGKPMQDVWRQGGDLSARPGQSPLQSAEAECALGLGLYLRRDVGRLRLCRLCHRRLCTENRRLARVAHGARRLCSRCFGASRARSKPLRRARPS